MADNLFDDEEEYNPTQAAPTKDVGPDSDEGEYKPQSYTEPTDTYDYNNANSSEVPTGYGAERAQLMTEEPISMPPPEASQPIQNVVESNTES
jgi:hypothetical protein